MTESHWRYQAVTKILGTFAGVDFLPNYGFGVYPFGFVFMLSFISSCRWNVIGKLSNLCFASKNRATAISTLSMLIALSYTGIMLVFSWLSQKSGMPFLWISLFMAALGFVFLLPLALRLRKKLKHKEIDFELQVAPEIERSLEQQQP